jgi:hypothetical protein
MSGQSLAWRDRAQVARCVLLHAAALGVFVVPFRWPLIGWWARSYLVRMFGVTAGYHRYFSHRSYKLARWSQFVLALLAQTAGQKEQQSRPDVHSPREGFWWARRLAAFDALRSRRPPPDCRSCALPGAGVTRPASLGADGELRHARLGGWGIIGVRLGLSAGVRGCPCGVRTFAVTG